MEIKKITPNKKQKECIETLSGPVMVLAGPGTGKTFTVIERIKDMREPGITPEKILCLTFSDAAANEMRQRLIKKIGIKASGVDVYTYHAFCNDIIKQNPDEFDFATGVSLINETSARELMKQTIDEADLKYFISTKVGKYYYLTDFKGYIEKLKSLRITKEKYMSFIDSNSTLLPKIKEIQDNIYVREQNGETRNKTLYNNIEKIKTQIEKAKELYRIYEIYSEKMLNHNFIDFSDMINFVIDKFIEDKTFLKEISNKYEYFLVDEYQDTNALQNKIIFELIEGNDKKNVFVVGDDDQIIYGFQGAKSDTIENFLNKYPETKVICLSENNRSCQNILDLSYLITSQNDRRIELNPRFSQYNISKKLTAKNSDVIKKERKIRRLQFANTLQEYNLIVDDISKLVNSADCPKTEDGKNDLSKIAIIVKKREEGFSYAEMLRGKNIPCQMDKGDNIFSIRSSILVYFYLKALYNHVLNSDKLFPLLLSEPFKIDYDDYNKILELNRLNKKDFITNIKSIDEWQKPEKISKFLDTFESLKSYAQNNNLRDTVIEILNRTGILAYFMNNEINKYINILGIKTILDVATDFERTNLTASIADFVNYLDDAFNNNISIMTSDNSVIQNAIQIMTYHSSKGREFDYVYLPNLITNSWEDFSMRNEYKFITDEVLDDFEKQQKKDEELTRLLFVGITRAKYGLTLSFADMCDEKAQQVTKYLNVDFDFESKQFPTNADDFFKEFVKSITHDALENQKMLTTEVQARVDNFVMSPSMLNKYLNCPRNFFYSSILGLDVSDSNWDSANYGTVFHKTLELLVKNAKENGTYMQKDELLKLFEKHIDSQIFSNDDVKENYLKRGRTALEEHYPEFTRITPEYIEDIEYQFNLPDTTGEIKGKIDRIERFESGNYGLYDYKTSSPTSSKQLVEGGKKEDYYNQLCFYKYGFEKLTGKKVSDVGIIYVEETTKNVHLALINKDMKSIERKIKTDYDNIHKLKFNKPENAGKDTC